MICKFLTINTISCPDSLSTCTLCLLTGSLFNGCQRVSAGFPISSGDSVFNKTANIDQSLYSDGVKVSAIGSDLQRHHQTASANVHMVDVCRPNIHQITSGICSPLTTTDLGMIRNVQLASRPMTSEELLSSTHLPTLSKPLVQPVNQLQAASHMHSNLSDSLFLLPLLS